MMTSCLWLHAPNDTNGNPRRLYLLLKDNRVIGCADEGYHGRPDSWPHDCLAVSITAREYKIFLRRYENRGQK
jgi:hypothetical protein